MMNESMLRDVFFENESSLEKEYQAVREGIAFCDLSHIKLYEIRGDEAIDYLDFVLTGFIGRLREGSVMHTLCIDNNGDIISDIYVVNVDYDLCFVLADGGDMARFDGFLKAHTGDFEVALKDVTENFALFSVDGLHSMVPMERICGPEILGLRYSRFLTMEADNTVSYILRAGKTGEFGFWAMTPRKNGRNLFERLWQEANDTEFPVSTYGRPTDALLRLENNFLNIDTEGAHTKNPLELGLFWALQLDKDLAAQDGFDKLMENNMRHRVVGFKVEEGQVQSGDRVFYKDKEIGFVAAAEHSFSLGKQIGKAIVKSDYSYPGIRYETDRDSTTIKTTNMPFVLNKSLTLEN